jgi:hypothetical protein
MKKIIPFILLMSVAGCATIGKVENAIGTITGANVSPTTVYVAANSYDALQNTAINYLKLPVCGTQPCRVQTTSQKVLNDLRTGDKVRTNLENLVNAGNGNQLVPTSLYQSFLAVEAAIHSDLGV